MLRPLTPPRRPRGLRMDLLGSRVVAFDEFAQYEEELGLDDRPLHPIPVLLGPNETMVEYERDFELWLAIRNVSLESLQDHPGIERLFRLDYSNSRYMELRRQYFRTEAQLADSYYPEKRSPDTWKHYEEEIPSDYGEERRFRTRDELLDWRLVSPETFLSAMEDFGPNGRIHRGEKLRPIAVVLRPGETSSSYELNFHRWLSKKNVTMAMLEDDPEEERRLRQCFAYVRAFELMNRKCAVQRSRDQNARAEMSMDRNQKRPRLELDVGNAMEKSIIVPVGQKTNELSKAGDKDTSCASSTTISEPPYSPTDFDAECSGVPNNRMKNETPVISPGAGNSDLVTATSENGGVNAANKDIYDTAANISLRAKQIEVDSVERKLVEDYIRVNQLLFHSESTINDSFSRDKTDPLIHETNSTEKSMQSDALPDTFGQEKYRQNAALASLIAHEWRDEQDIPKQDIQPSAGDAVELVHDKLMAIYGQVLRNDDEVLTLRIKLNNRLNWLKATDTDRDAQFRELQEISSALDEELEKRSRLKEQRRVRCVDLLQSNEEIRMLVMGLVEDMKRIKQS